MLMLETENTALNSEIVRMQRLLSLKDELLQEQQREFMRKLAQKDDQIRELERENDRVLREMMTKTSQQHLVDKLQAEL